MYGEILIGEKTVPMLSMASTDVYYKRIFREDPLVVQAESIKSEDYGAQIDMTMKLAYVMAKFAELKTPAKMNKLNEDTYVEWLDQFSREDFYEALEDIRKVYEGQQIRNSSSKKAEGE